ncbi:ATP-binding protein [Paenibacillus koleovorans]|uniref:ATP-binding protein n=1 Tax=Paenibacillus koleovorans TaxID=121608 RepID=UPI000FD9CE0D|nr:ATP-binding protein [Paenibacillus koleovorans]
MNTRVHKRRSFMKELLIWIGLLVVLPLFGLFQYFNMHTFSGLKAIEREKAIQSNRAAKLSIEALGESILGVTITNGYWEANRQAVLKRDFTWLKKNIGDMPDVVPNVEFVAETDMQGNVLVQSGDVAEFDGKLQYLFLLDRIREEESFSGLLRTSKGMALVAVSQVTGDSGEFEPAGLLITGRFLNADMLQSLEHTLQTSLAVLTTNGQFLSSTNDVKEESLHPYMQELLAKPEGEELEERFTFERLNDYYMAEVDAPLHDMNGDTIGVVHTQVESVSATQIVDSFRSLAVFRLVAITVLLALVVLLLRYRILLPLRHFTASLAEVAAGRSIDSIPKHVLQAEAEIVRAIQQIAQWNHTLEATVRRRTSSIRSLLDNANQGFLSVGADLLVREEYSVECTRIFPEAGVLTGLALPNLLYPTPNDSKDRELLTSILNEYFMESDAAKRELILSLLPEEVTIGGKVLQIEAKPMNADQAEDMQDVQDMQEGDSLMVMLTDITEKRRLEALMEAEQASTRMLAQAVMHADDLADVVRDFERFAQTEVAETLADDGETPVEKALSLYKAVHTFKGSFGFLRFGAMVAMLHELESGLQELLSRSGGFTAEQLAAYMESQPLLLWLQEEEAVLQRMLGDSFEGLGARQSVKVSLQQWRRLEQWAGEQAQTESDRMLLAELRAMRNKPVQSLLKQYPPYLEELAERRGLRVHPVVVRGGELPVDTERYYPFAKSLVHVVRNIAIHGIEPEAERVAAGKDPYGRVTIEATHSGGCLRIEIADDGRGIDADILRRKAASMPNSDVAAILAMSDEEAVQLIFREQFSTARRVTEWAGRGIGLSAVKEEVERLGGTIRVTTERGHGTRFEFILPDEG